MGADYKAIGDPGDVQNINPYTQNAWNQMSQMFPAAQEGMQGIIGAISNMGTYDPNAWLGQLQSQNPTLQGFVQQAVDPFYTASESYARAGADQARRAVEAQYAGRNIYSGDFAQAVGKGMAMPYMEAAKASEQLQAQTYGGLLQLAAQLNAQQQQTAAQTELEKMAQQGGMYESMMNTAGAGMAQLGAPEWWQPTYVQDTSGLKGALGGALSGALTGIMSGNPWGALVGGIGGLGMGALGMSGAAAGQAASGYFGARQDANQYDDYMAAMKEYMNPVGYGNPPSPAYHSFNPANQGWNTGGDWGGYMTNPWANSAMYHGYNYMGTPQYDPNTWPW